MMNLSVSRISKKDHYLTNSIFIAIAIFALIKPDSLQYLGLGVLEGFLIIFDILLAILLLLNIMYFSISKLTLLVIIMYVFTAIPTFLNYTNYYYLAASMGPAITSCLFADLCMQKAPMKYIKTSMITLGILATINLITVILFPGGMYKSDMFSQDTYFLGYDNGFLYTFIPYIGFALMYSKMMRGKYISSHSLYAIIISIITELLVWSATGIVSVFFMLICVIAWNTPLIRKLFKPRILIGLFFAGTILIVFFRVIDVFSPIIVGILHKDITFTGRTWIWDSALKAIKENWLMGIGQGGRTLARPYGLTNATHPHCLILDLLYRGGVLMLGAFLCLISRFVKQTSRWIDLPITPVVLMVVSCILFAEIINSAQYKPFFWTFIVMATYIPKLSGYSNSSKDFVKIKFV